MKYAGLAFLLILFLATLIAAPAVSDPLSVRETSGIVTIENALTSVAYDLHTGKYSAIDKKDDKSCVEDAFFTANDLSSTAGTWTRTWEEHSLKDDLGFGKNLRITCAASGSPNLILDISLYKDKSFVVLSAGMDNQTGNAVVVKDIRPLTGARTFADIGTKSDLRTLNGTSGCAETRVSSATDIDSPNNVLLTFTVFGKRKSLILGGLTYHDYAKFVRIHQTDDGKAFDIEARCSDPVGRLVDAGTKYLPDDRFFLDFTTGNPFLTLEQYASSIRAAQDVRPNIYIFPEVFGGLPSNDSVGAVVEMEAIKKSGFLKYARAGVSIVADRATDNGWWDDAYLQKCGLLLTPYETTAKWARAVNNLGGIPGICVQPGAVSADYIKAHPEQLLFKDVAKVNAEESPLDYTSAAFRKHIAEGWSNLSAGGVKSATLDSPETGWHPGGGFEDKHATSASAYRAMFDSAKSGLGAFSYLEERSSSPEQSSDITIGLADARRVCADDAPLQDVYTQCALRWYKSRSLYSFDIGIRELPKNVDGRRQLLTLAYLAGARLLLSTSFSKLSSEEIRDLTRVFPINKDPQSARPLDAFTNIGVPQVYDFPVNQTWHQLAFYNSDLGKDAVVGVDLSLDSSFGGLGLSGTKSYYVYDFWNDRLVGKVQGGGRLEQVLRPGEVRMMSVHEVEENPQFISTNRHLLQGYIDLFQTHWSPSNKELTGVSRVVGGEAYRVVLAMNGFVPQSCSASGATCRLEGVDKKSGLAVVAMDRAENGMVGWSVVFSKE